MEASPNHLLWLLRHRQSHPRGAAAAVLRVARMPPRLLLHSAHASRSAPPMIAAGLPLRSVPPYSLRTEQMSPSPSIRPWERSQADSIRYRSPVVPRCVAVEFRPDRYRPRSLSAPKSRTRDRLAQVATY